MTVALSVWAVSVISASSSMGGPLQLRICSVSPFGSSCPIVGWLLATIT